MKKDMLARMGDSKLGRRIGAGALILGPVAAFADPPIDLTTAGTTLAGYVATAAALGIGVFIALQGVRVLKRAFRSAAA